LLKIALIDDDESCILRLKEMLERYAKENGENFHIDTFSYGIDFISEYSAVYDLIFMDIDMPHMNGLKTAKLLRKIDDKVPLIFVTHLVKYAIKGYEVDAFDFIIKPLEYESLCFKLKKLFSKIKERDEAYLLVSSRMGKMKVYIPIFIILPFCNVTLCFIRRKGIWKCVFP
jgi:DNA-binding LytR/AlgR family response regulator